jgi:ABC-type nitrate/sulfonate/bicarbonate transport system ATPase subunit
MPRSFNAAQHDVSPLGQGASPAPASRDQPCRLVVQDVTKVFTTSQGSITALAGQSLTVEAGELLALVGPSGSGKSTLLRLLAGLDVPTSGTILLDDTPIRGPSAERGLIFQDPSLFPWLTVRGNIQAGLVASGRLRQRRSAVEDMLRLVGLENFAEMYPHQLSGGMAQRVALARALVNHPRILLLDEPLGALDQFTRMRLQDEILRLWQARRTTMLLVTHDIDEALYMSDRIAILTPSPGRVERLLTVDLERPRQRASPRFLELRAQILEILHFADRPRGVIPSRDDAVATTERPAQEGFPRREKSNG